MKTSSIPQLESLGRLLFRPQSIALVSVSDKRETPAGRPLSFLRRSGFEGRVYPVRRGREEVQGEPCWNALEDLPEVPEHVFLLGAGRTVFDELTTCIRLGVPMVTVLAGGFAEAGPEGQRLAEQLRALIDGSATRVLGPNSLGVASLVDNVRLTANAAFSEDFVVGRCLFASHSGSLLGAVATRARSRGGAFAAFVSVGAELDLTLREICATTLDDPRIASYGLFLEHLGNAGALERFCIEASARGKPVVAFKLGRTRQAARLAATHTGAIVGADDIANAFFRDAGIVRVHHLDAIEPATVLASRLAAIELSTLRIGIVSTTGGGAALLVDELGVRGIDANPLDETGAARLNALGVAYDGQDIVDLTLAGTRPELMTGVLDVLLDKTRFDLVLVVLGSSAASQPEVATAPLRAIAKRSRVAMAVLVLPDAQRAVELLRRDDIAAFSAPEVCADVVAAICQQRAAQPGRRPPLPLESVSGPASSGEDMLDRLGIAQPSRTTVRLALAEAASIACRYPVAVKISSDAIAHKTDVGGVMLDVPDADGLGRTLATMRSRFGEEACIQIQEMVTDGVAELLLGFLRDDEVGPVVTLAAGGIFAELSRHRSVRRAPVSEQDAAQMITELPELAVLAGYRGRPAGDVQSLASAISRFSMLAGHAELLEAEINPLIVRPVGLGVSAVDVLARFVARSGG